MIGLLFLGTVAVWLSVCVWLAQKFGNVIAKPPWRIAVSLIALLFLFSLPFVDEVIGKRQFETLCRTNGIESADISKARGKKVKGELGKRTYIEGPIMPIQTEEVSFRDADSDEVLIRHKDYYASGGWVMRYTWLSMGSSHPMLFSGNGCGFAMRDRIFKAAQISVIN